VVSLDCDPGTQRVLPKRVEQNTSMQADAKGTLPPVGVFEIYHWISNVVDTPEPIDTRAIANDFVLKPKGSQRSKPDRLNQDARTNRFRLREFLENANAVAVPCELKRRSETGKTGTDNRNTVGTL
jgi:hypothetical protein